MANFKRPTTVDLINNGKYPNVAAGTIIETLGYTTKGDGGGAQWKKTGVTGLTVSQSPADLVDAKLTDANGHEWEIVHVGRVLLSALGLSATLPNNQLIVQAAVDYLQALGGGTLVYPSGTIRQAPVFIPYDNLHFEGQGVGSTEILLPDSPLSNQGPTFNFGIMSDFTTTVVATDCSVRNLSVNGNKANQLQGNTNADGGNGGIYSWKISGLLVENVDVYNCDGYGLGFVGTNQTPREFLTVRNVRTHNNNYDGLDIKAGMVGVTIDDVYSFDNGPPIDPSRNAVGIDLRGANVRASNIHAYNNNGIGVRIRDGDATALRTNLTGIYANNNDQDGIHVNGTDDGEYRLVGCHSWNNGRYGILHSNGNADFVGCECTGNTTDGFRTETASESEDSRIIGGAYSNNGQDGVNATVGAGKLFLSSGVEVKGNARYGGNMKRVFSISDAQIQNNTIGVFIDAVSEGWAIRNASIIDTRAGGSKTQTNALQFINSPSSGFVRDSDLTENITGPITGGIPAGTRLSDNKGVATKNNYLSSSFAVDVATVVQVTITHGLDVTPASEDIQATVVRETNVNDYTINFIRVSGISGSIVNLQVGIGTASGTGGATAKLAVLIDSEKL